MPQVSLARFERRCRVLNAEVARLQQLTATLASRRTPSGIRADLLRCLPAMAAKLRARLAAAEACLHLWAYQQWLKGGAS